MFLNVALALTIAAPSLFTTTRLHCEGGSSWGSSAAAFAIDTPSPSFTWANHHPARGTTQSSLEFELRQHSSSAATFTDMPLVWKSDLVTSTASSFKYPASAPTLHSTTTYAFNVRYADQHGNFSSWSAAPALFHYAAPDWSHAKWIGSNTTNLYRASFENDNFSSAVVYACALGYGYVRINGEAAGVDGDKRMLTTSPWSNNMQRNGYSTLDITKQLVAGENVIGVGLGHGWRDQSSFKRRDPAAAGTDGTDRVLRLMLVVTSALGVQSTLTATGDGKWTTAAGPSTYDNVYNGETYDASLEQPGWDAPAFNVPPGWIQAEDVADHPMGTMSAWAAPPVLTSAVVPALKVTHPRPNTFVVDFGVNQAGVTRINDLSKFELRKGDVITMKHAEILEHEYLPGTHAQDYGLMIYQGNLRSALATDRYTAKGGDSGSWMPKFTYHGYRYVEVTLPSGNTIAASDVSMVHFHSAVPVKTKVDFSSPTISAIQKLAAGAQRSNMMTVATDCDQRDERLGWMGDMSLSVDSICLNYDCAAFAKSFVRAMDDEMAADGSLPDVVPFDRYGGRPADVSWSDAFIQSCYVLYKESGDIGPATTYYADMLRQLDNVAVQAKAGLGKLRTPYGDWCPPPATAGAGQGPKPSSPYTSAFSYIHMVQQTSELASALGNTTEANRLGLMATSLLADFNAAFLKAGAYDAGIMTDYSLAIALGAANVSSVVRASALDTLSKLMSANNNHHTTGIIGYKFLHESLRAGGHEDQALANLENTGYPSIGYMFANEWEKASANLWELLDAFHEGNGMNSRNHHMWSSYSKYIVQRLGGLAHDGATNHAHMTPASTLGLSAANASVLLPHGTASLRWSRAGGTQCAKVAANYGVTLDCGSGGGEIVNVTFASFGAPAGMCGAFVADQLCHSNTTAAKLAAMCVGKARCEIPKADSTTFGHPGTGCSTRGGEAWLWAEVQCRAPVLLHAVVELPIGSTGTIVFPTGLYAVGGKTVVINESGNTLDVDAITTVGINSIRYGKDHADRNVIFADLGSGVFNFAAAL